MISDLSLEKILFLDIETVSQFENYEGLSDPFKKLWDKKAQFLIKEDETSADAYSKAAIYAEFGKIVCISVGFLSFKNNISELRVKSFYGEDEYKILTDFFKLLNNHYDRDDHYLCAHNGKEFDFPYISRRAIIHNLPLPTILQLHQKKPWEVKHLDTLQLWKFGDYKSYTSLELMAAILDIPTPKDDIDGSMVGEVYWKEKNLKRIVIYCQKDVETLTRVFLRLIGQNISLEVNIAPVD